MQLIRTRPPKLSAARRSLLRFQRCSRYFEKLISHCQCRWQLLLSVSLANVASLTDVPCHSHHVRISAREAVLLLLGCSDYGVDGEAWRLCSGILFVLWRQTVASIHASARGRRNISLQHRTSNNVRNASVRPILFASRSNSLASPAPTSSTIPTEDPWGSQRGRRRTSAQNSRACLTCQHQAVIELGWESRFVWR